MMTQSFTARRCRGVRRVSLLDTSPDGSVSTSTVEGSLYRDAGSARVLRGSKIYKLFKSLRLRPPTPEAYGKTADFGTLCIPGSSQRRDPSAALLSSSDRSRLAALNVMLTPCPVP